MKNYHDTEAGTQRAAESKRREAEDIAREKEKDAYMNQQVANAITGKDDRSCFPANASILTPNGWQNISSLSTGSTLLALSKHGKLRRCEVLQYKVYAPTLIATVILNDKTSFDVTRHHTILTQRGWIKVGMLKANDILTHVASNGKIAKTTVTKVIDSGRNEPVFNLIVDNEFTFIVDGCVAHSFTNFRKLRMLWYSSIRQLTQMASPIRDVYLLGRKRLKTIQ